MKPISVALLGLLLGLSGCASQRPVDMVYPFLDSVNSRWFFFDSASRPFGLVNLSPDTEIGGAWGSGYRYNSESIKGFSHVHAWQLSGPSVMPVVSDLPLERLKDDYFSAFSHDREIARPGYHQVWLDRYDIDVELTATTRVGFHRYFFPENSTPKILFKLGGKLGPVVITDARIEKIGDRTLSGFVENGSTVRRTRATPVFFRIELNRPIEKLLQRKGDAALIELSSSTGPVLMKVAISYTSEAGAENNLRAELGHWDFDAVREDAENDWNEWLARVEIKGGSEQQRKRFYTDLWHALQGRRIISDVDGSYSDQTGEVRAVRQIPTDDAGNPLFNHHNSDSFWGAQWTINTLWPLIYPKVASDFSNSLLQYYKDGGLIPRGPSGGNYTFVMTGASSTPFIVSNWMKGIRDFDIDVAYEGLKKNHSSDGIMARAGYEHGSQVGGGISYYLERGYVPYPIPEDADQSDGYHFHWKGAGQTLEYAFQDHALAQLARTLGHADDAAYFFERSKNYRHLFDVDTGFVRPREMSGYWRENFDPYGYEVGFVESNAAQMTWFPAHDIEGLATLMGGKQALIEKLDKEFRKAASLGFTSGKAHKDEKDERFSRIPINYGNQPSIQTAFIFAAAGAPWKTQYWSREVINSVFSGLAPDTGYNGDEDQGLMGSLAVLMKIGLFQLNGGTEPDPVYWLSSPIFDEIVLYLDNRYFTGKRFIIRAENNSDTNRYIQSISLNGKHLKRAFLRHSEIAAGGSLVLTMGDSPNRTIE